MQNAPLTRSVDLLSNCIPSPQRAQRPTRCACFAVRSSPHVWDVTTKSTTLSARAPILQCSKG